MAVLSTLAQCVVIFVIVCSATRLKVKITEKGISADSSFHKQSLYGRAARYWSDLHSVRLRKFTSSAAILDRVRAAQRSRLDKPSLLHRILDWLGKGWSRQGFLVLDFRSGGQAAFPLAGFSERSLESLFLALSRWADPLTMNPDVISLQRDILTGEEIKLGNTYTQMWEESLRQRFEVTNFVPLQGGQELKGGELKILMLLACGGMSSIYLARNSKGERLVVKEMAVPDSASSVSLEKVHEMFDREAKILARLDHPKIVKVLDHFVEGGRDYLVLEFTPGLTLRQQVQMHGAFAQEDVLKIAGQLADILSYLHGFSPPIIHRDLTPDNIVIRSSDRQVVLIDFGAANEFVGAVTGTLIGKQCYIPPEQFRGQALPQSDLYALGATMHYLLTAEDPEPITCSHPALLNREISAEMDGLVAELTAPGTAERVLSAEELSRRLLKLNVLPDAGRRK